MPDFTADTLSILTWLIGGQLLIFMLFPFAYFGVMVADKLREATGLGR